MCQPCDSKARLWYFVFLVLGFAFCLVLRYTDVSVYVTRWAVEGGCSTKECVRDHSIYRVSFALFAFFFLHYLASNRVNCCCCACRRADLSRSWLPVRFVALLGILFGAFHIPNWVFTYYAWLSFGLSILFLVAKIIVLVDMTYTWNDCWGLKGRRHSKFWYGLLIVMLVAYAGAALLVSYEFIWFAGDASCKIARIVLIVIVVCAAIYTLLSVIVSHGSLLPSAIVFIYTAWLAFWALSVGSCGPCNLADVPCLLYLVIAAVFAFGALIFVTTSVSAAYSAFEESCADPTEDAAEEASANAFSFFHLMMALASAFLAMLVTQWHVIGGNGSIQQNSDGDLIMWAKLGAGGAVILLYVWTLVGPIIAAPRPSF